MSRGIKQIPMLDFSSGLPRYAIQSDAGLSLTVMAGKLPCMILGPWFFPTQGAERRNPNPSVELEDILKIILFLLACKNMNTMEGAIVTAGACVFARVALL